MADHPPHTTTGMRVRIRRFNVDEQALPIVSSDSKLLLDPTVETIPRISIPASNRFTLTSVLLEEPALVNP
jgi:hypothetical protein